LEDRGQALEAGLGEEGGAPLAAELAGPEWRVTIAVGPEGGLGVVHVEAGEPVGADDLHTAIDHLGEPVRGPDVEPRGEHVAGVQAEPDPIVAASQLDQPGKLVERAPAGPARPGPSASSFRNSATSSSS